jgi:glycosyltransferase involved in cell wall biosynthesis
VGIPCSSADGLSPRLAQSWRGSFDVLHLHWPELLYAAPHLGKSLRLAAAVLLGLAWAKSGGCRLVCTVHNLSAHDQVFPVLNRLANRTILGWADALHVHDESVRDAVAQAYGRQGHLYVIPHGSYIGVYPNRCTREEARERLGLAHNAFVYLFLGQVRRYKGIEELLVAFRQLVAPGSELVIAGNVHDPTYAAQLAGLGRDEARIRTWFEYVRDSDIQYFMNACDVCVVPYRDVTTSGAAILAFSFGKPIIAPALGSFRELVQDGRGIAYSPAAADGLLCALQQARSADMVAAGTKALQWAEEHEWSMLAPRFVRMYIDVLGPRK